MDLSKLAAEESHFDDAVPCVLYTESGDPEQDSQGKDVTLQIVSEHARVVRRASQANGRDLGRLIRRFGSDNIPPRETDALVARRLAAHIVGWSGVEENGRPLAWSADKAVALVEALMAHRPKQIAQIEGAIAGHSAFFAKPSSA